MAGLSAETSLNPHFRGDHPLDLGGSIHDPALHRHARVDRRNLCEQDRGQFSYSFVRSLEWVDVGLTLMKMPL